MKNLFAQNLVPQFKAKAWSLWVASVAAFIMLSPKWVVPLAAWVAPACMLMFVTYQQGRLKWLAVFIGLLIAQLIAGYEVIPAPFVVFLIIAVVGAFFGLLPYVIHHLISKKTDHFLSTLVFPAIGVSMEFMDSFGGAGVWSARANSQFDFTYLAQLASVTGLWGISFLVYWFNAILVWYVENMGKKPTIILPLAAYGLVLTMALMVGVYRIHFALTESQKKTIVGGVTYPQFREMEGLYEEVFNKKIKLDSKTSQTSPELQEFNKAFVTVVENSDTTLYPKSMEAMRGVSDSLFFYTRLAARQGAKIISWSEGSQLVFPFMEKKFLKQGAQLADSENIYLLMAYGLIHPGKLFPGKKFMENKAVLISPEGKVVNIFLKNKPVPMAEASVPGDGKIPVVETPFGKISVSICYDANFPSLMKQLAANQTDLLLLPSGDWFAISPYHSYMSVFRGIENGTPILRQVSGGLSYVSDARGVIQGSKDFYTDNRKFWTAPIVTGHSPTIYSWAGDWVAYLSIVIVAIAFIYLVWVYFQDWRRIKFSQPQSETKLGQFRDVWWP